MYSEVLSARDNRLSVHSVFMLKLQIRCADIDTTQNDDCSMPRLTAHLGMHAKKHCDQLVFTQHDLRTAERLTAFMSILWSAMCLCLCLCMCLCMY